MKTSCPYCQQILEIGHQFYGLKKKCPACSKMFVVASDVPIQDDPLLQGLNPEQVQAVVQTGGFLRVVAGPGAGKTRVLTHRAAFLIRNLQVPPEEVLSVTFTNKAAGEMRSRIKNLLGEDTTTRVQTFHGFCNTVLREDIPHLHFPESFVIMDQEDQRALVKECLAKFGLTFSRFSFESIADSISAYKKDTEYVVQIVQKKQANPPAEEKNTLQKVVLTYLAYQKQRYLLDYDDLLYYTLFIFRNFPSVLKKWQKRLSYIQVDEFQDVNFVQYEIVRLLAGLNKNLFVVGDPDQTIYEWRGADVRYFMDFPADQTIKLHRNYRSTPQIVAAGNFLISRNQNRIENTITAVRGDGEPVQIMDNYEKEPRWILQHIRELVKSYPYSSIAILCRALWVTGKIEEVFVKNNIPYHIYNGINFYQRKEIKDSLSFLRLACADDDLSFLRVINVPARGVGKKRLEQLTEFAGKNGCSLFEALQRNLNSKMFSGCAEFVQIILELRERMKSGEKVSDLLHFVLEKTGYEEIISRDPEKERAENLQELFSAIAAAEEEKEGTLTLEEYLSHVSLYSERKERKEADSVKILTVHNAKGLEFPCVFVVSMNEGVFPSSHAEDPESIEEERRVAYVALTRAADRLFLSSDDEVKSWEHSYSMKSRFLREISRGMRKTGIGKKSVK